MQIGNSSPRSSSGSPATAGVSNDAHSLPESMVLTPNSYEMVCNMEMLKTTCTLDANSILDVATGKSLHAAFICLGLCALAAVVRQGCWDPLQRRSAFLHRKQFDANTNPRLRRGCARGLPHESESFANKTNKEHNSTPSTCWIMSLSSHLI